MEFIAFPTKPAVALTKFDVVPNVFDTRFPATPVLVPTSALFLLNVDATIFPDEFPKAGFKVPVEFAAKIKKFEVAFHKLPVRSDVIFIVLAKTSSEAIITFPAECAVELITFVSK